MNRSKEEVAQRLFDNLKSRRLGNFHKKRLNLLKFRRFGIMNL